MVWWQVLIAWLMFQGLLGMVEPGQEVESPSFLVTWSDGRRFEVAFKVRRTGGPS